MTLIKAKKKVTRKDERTVAAVLERVKERVKIKNVSKTLLELKSRIVDVRQNCINSLLFDTETITQCSCCLGFKGRNF